MLPTDRLQLACAAVFGATGVALGAFGAHALAARLSPALLATWRTAVDYQLLHALALLAVVLLATHSGGAMLRRAGWAFVAGVLLFSGSLYVLALDGPRWLGPVTPIGGVLLVLGWVLLAVHAVRSPR